MKEHEKIIISNEDEDKKEEDPIESYGYGVVAYFSLLEYLAKLFAFFSIFAFFLLYLYKTNNYESQNSKYLFGSLTLGNLHSTSRICLS